MAKKGSVGTPLDSIDDYEVKRIPEPSYKPRSMAREIENEHGKRRNESNK